MGQSDQKERVIPGFPGDLLPPPKQKTPAPAPPGVGGVAREALERTTHDVDALFGGITRLGRKPA